MYLGFSIRHDSLLDSKQYRWKSTIQHHSTHPQKDSKRKAKHETETQADISMGMTQDPKTVVLYHPRPYFGGISPEP